MTETPYQNISLDQVMEKADGCSTFSEFVEKHQSEYNAAVKYNWLDHILTKVRDDRPNWGLESLKAEAEKYSSMSEFAAGSTGAYIAARDGGYLTELEGCFRKG